jgi:hypothetical protein
MLKRLYVLLGQDSEIVIRGTKSYKTSTIKQEEIYCKSTILKVKIRHLRTIIIIIII